MPSQRIILGIGLAILLIIGAASIGLDLKSRGDTAAIEHSTDVLRKIWEVRSGIHRAESAIGRFTLTPTAEIEKLYRDARADIRERTASLIDAVRDNPVQNRVFEATRSLIDRRLEVTDEALRLRQAGDTAGLVALTAKAEGAVAMDAINATFDKVIAEERQLLSDRNAKSKRNGRFLLAVDLAGVLLILLLTALLARSAMRASRELQESLTATKATNEALEAAVAERTAHLVAAHEDLQHSTEIIQQTFNTVAEGVLVLDARGRVILSNAAARKMLRYEEGASVRDIQKLGVGYRADGVTRLTGREMPSAQVLRGDPVDEQEIVLRPADGRPAQHLVVSGRPLRDAAGAIRGAALVYHDVTAWRETERKLQQSQKLDAIGKLTGGVAHDFNNMLTVITGTTETLVAGLKDHPNLQKTAELIDVAAERCSELIQHLLAFARRQPLQPRNVDVNGTVLDIAKLLRPTLGEAIEIDTILEPEVAAAHIDASQLANALLNLAINSRDAMPGGGKLLLETRNVVLDEAYAQANPDVMPGPYVMLAVSDTGIGMSKEVQDKLFEPFFTTKEVGKGSGLGMSMVYGFVKQSGGHIRVYSEEGQGTTVKLYLPPARGAAAASVAAAAPPEGGTETILVVEDDDLVRSFVTTQLKSLGYLTLDTADGQSALQAVDNGVPFDLLFTDMILPNGMSGRQLADEVAKRRPGVKVLYTSGYTDNAIVHHGRLDPGVMLLSKPYRKAQLAKSIRDALRAPGA